MFFNPFHPKRVKEGGWKLQGEGGLHQVLRQFTFKGVTFEVTSSSCTTRPLLPKELLHDAVSRASHFPTLNVFLMVETWPTTREKIREWGNVGDGIGERRFCATIFKSPSLDKKKKEEKGNASFEFARLSFLTLSLSLDLRLKINSFGQGSRWFKILSFPRNMAPWTLVPDCCLFLYTCTCVYIYQFQNVKRESRFWLNSKHPKPRYFWWYRESARCWNFIKFFQLEKKCFEFV